MSLRACVRNAVYVFQDLKDYWWPSQLVDALREADYAKVAAHDAEQALNEYEEENEYLEGHGDTFTESPIFRPPACGSGDCFVCRNAAPQRPLSDSELAAIRRLMTVCDGINFGAVRELVTPSEYTDPVGGTIPPQSPPAPPRADGDDPAGTPRSAGSHSSPAAVEHSENPPAAGVLAIADLRIAASIFKGMPPPDDPLHYDYYALGCRLDAAAQSLDADK